MAYKPQYWSRPDSDRREQAQADGPEPQDWKNFAISATRTSSSSWDTEHPVQPILSAHPPLAEQQEPACPIRKLVTPTDGAKAGDRVRYIQFTDSMYNAPCQPYQRSYLESYRFRGIDPVPCPGVRLSSAANATSRNMQRNSSAPSSLMQHSPVSVAARCTGTPSVSTRTA